MPACDLNIALLPIDIQSGNIDANIDTIYRLVKSLPKETDLAVLPELCFTGFIADRDIMANLARKGEATLDAMMNLSEESGKAITGGYLATEGQSLYNRGFIITPGHQATCYNKRHLFCSGGEAKIFTCGKEYSPVVEYKTWHLKMAICYDVRFPAWCRNINLEYDALIVPANWPKSRSFAWQHLLAARAIENQAYVIGCDRMGKDLYGSYALNDSVVFDHWGQIVSVEDTSTGIVKAKLSHEALNECRERFTPYRDADKFTIRL